MLLSVVGAPPQDADCGGRDAPKLYLGFSQAMGRSELIPSVVPARDVTPLRNGHGIPMTICRRSRWCTGFDHRRHHATAKSCAEAGARPVAQ